MTNSTRVSQPNPMLAWALLVVLILSMYYGCVVPLVERYHIERDSIAQKELDLEKLKRMSARYEALVASERKVQSNNAEIGDYLPATSPALAAAALQQQVKRIADEVGITISSTNVLAPKTDMATAVGMTIQGKATIDALSNALRELETGKPAIFVTRLTIRNEAEQRTSGSADGNNLNIELEVTGYMIRK